MTLADVGKVITGNTPPTADAENYGDAIPFVKPTELVDRGIRSAPSGLAPQAMGKARVVPAGAVLVSCIGNLGKTGIAKVPVAFNQQINAVVFNENVIPEFGFYYAQTLKPWLYGESSATTIPIVNKGKFQQARFPLAPLDEQREIVAELEKQFSRLDEAVANLQRVKANLKRYKASVLKAAVEGRLVETEATLARREGRTFETGEQLLQRILEERRAKWRGKGRYKEPVAQTAEFTIAVTDGWTSATVDQLASVQLGKMLDKQKHKAGEPYRYLRNINVRWGTFDVSDVFEMNFESDELERFSVRAGDVLVCEGGEPARAAVWRAKQTDMKYQKALHRVRFDGAYLPDLIAIALEHLAKSGALDELYGGSTIKHFTRETFVKLVLPVPPAAEQARIVAEVDRHLSIIREVEVEVEANLQRAQALRQATLAKAFANT
jgi:type I restriction enzyme S subunit